MLVAASVLGVACGNQGTAARPTTSEPSTSVTSLAGETIFPGSPEPNPGPLPSTEPSGSDAQLLLALRVAPEADPGRYNRDTFGYPDAGIDSRGCNTRARVLQRDTTLPAQVSYPGCKVLAGRWTDFTTGSVFEDPAKVSIDHLVPLKEAYRSGASSWSTATMVAFGNDVDRPEALKVIGGSGNASKGDKDPAKWKPPLRSAWPAYARAWLVMKVAYDLSADQAESDALRAMLDPPGLRLAPSPPARAPSELATSTTNAPAGPGSGGASYANCAAVRAAGKAPLLRGEPGYNPNLDGDRDGIACE